LPGDLTWFLTEVGFDSAQVVDAVDSAFIRVQAPAAVF